MMFVYGVTMSLFPHRVGQSDHDGNLGSLVFYANAHARGKECSIHQLL